MKRFADPNRTAERDALLRFLILGVRVEISCHDPGMRAVLMANFGQLRNPEHGDPPDLRYRVEGSSMTSIWLVCNTRTTLHAEDRSHLIYLLEKELILELQKRRPRLLFLHAAAVEHDGRAWLIAGQSGAGKSTMAWALLHHGCGYLSDELSPVDLDTVEVQPYQHALCVKRLPPAPYPLPRQGIVLERTSHVPVRALPGEAKAGARAVAGILLLERGKGTSPPLLEGVSAADATARLYLATLNALAHPAQGLDAVLRLTARVPCFSLRSGDLQATSRRVVQLFQSRSK